MKKITMYELLGLVKDGKAPKKIKYNDKIWRLASDGTYFIGSDYGYDFWVEHGDDKFEDESITLNDEVEIIEEDKKIPEKIDICTDATNMEYIKGKTYGKNYSKQALEIAHTINEIIDYLKSKGE